MLFVFPNLIAATSQSLVQTVMSQGGRFVRLLALRGTTASSRAPTGIDLNVLRLRVQLNGEEDLIGGNGTNIGVPIGPSSFGPNTASFATLFDDITSPWYRFWSPPLLRAGDLLTATVSNNEPTGEVSPLLSAEIGLRIIDDDLWQELYTRDWQAEKR